MVKIPTRLEDLLPAAALEKVMEVLHQPDISSSVREALHKVGLKDANPLGQVQDAWKQAKSWLESLTQKSGSGGEYSSTINATGQLIMPGFEAIPMGSSVAFAHAKAAVAFQNPEHLRRQAKEVCSEVFGRPAAWINNSLATLQMLHGGKNVVISRADSVRVPGFGDVRAMLTAFGNSVVELGAANGASEQDWASALTSANQLLLLVSPNSLGPELAAMQRKMAIKAAKHVDATVAELLVDGSVNPALNTQFGFPDIKQRFSDGAELVILPLHLLIGAPTGALMIGNEKLIQTYLTSAENLGVRCSAPELAGGLNALLSESTEASVLARLVTNPENLKDRCTRLAIQLNDTQNILSAIAVERTCPLGPTPWDRYRVHNWAVRVSPRENTLSAAERLRCRLLGGLGDQLPIACALEGSDLLLDLRFVGPEDDFEIVTACLGGSMVSPQGKFGLVDCED
jgi:seryl-tRNA(Sec) selenium transferase